MTGMKFNKENLIGDANTDEIRKECVLRYYYQGDNGITEHSKLEVTDVKEIKSPISKSDFERNEKGMLRRVKLSTVYQYDLDSYIFEVHDLTYTNDTSYIIVYRR